MSDELNFVLQARREKLDALEAPGVAPFAYAFDRTHDARRRVARCSASAEEGPTRARGWADRRRGAAHGKTAFAHLADASGTHPAVLPARTSSASERFAQLELFDIGDVVGVTGRCSARAPAR